MHFNRALYDVDVLLADMAAEALELLDLARTHGHDQRDHLLLCKIGCMDLVGVLRGGQSGYAREKNQIGHCKAVPDHSSPPAQPE